MKEKLEEFIETFGEEISGRLSSPAQHNTFTVNEEYEKLDK